MKLAVLVFPAYNNIVITSMVFSSIETGLAKVKELTGQDMVFRKPNQANSDHYGMDLSNGYYILDLDKEMNQEFECDNCPVNENHKECLHFSRKFFTGYYGGCGEAHEAILFEIEEGTPFNDFNLD